MSEPKQLSLLDASMENLFAEVCRRFSAQSVIFIAVKQITPGVYETTYAKPQGLSHGLSAELCMRARDHFRDEAREDSKPHVFSPK